MRKIYKLNESEIALTAESVVETLQKIAWQSGNQEQLTDNLTTLRNQAIKQRQKDLFDRALKIAKEQIEPEEMNCLEWRFRFNADDFGYSEEPYLEVFNQPTAFLEQRALERLNIEAAKCGYKRFKAMYKAFRQSMRQGNVSTSALINPSDFPEQPFEFECGQWHCDASGVSIVTKDREEYACTQPVMPIEILKNIDTGSERLRIAFYRDFHWESFVASKRDLFDSAKVIQYSELGLAVTSLSAKLLSKYFCEIESQNRDIIPKSESVSRLGYVKDGKFSPYVDNLMFDGEANYGAIYDAITQKGDYTTWLEEARKCRKETLTAKIMLAASFASPLIKKIGALPFFVHLWGVDSATGKTVALMLAASVWGNPDVGQYIQTFNSTQVGHEKTAAFLNNLPMLIDELQLSKDSHGHSKFDVYQLAQGVGRTRGNKGGGIDKTPTWSLCILTTGESPLTNDSNGAGAINRVIDIECKASQKAIIDGFKTSSCIKQNYGHAGRIFIEELTDDVIQEASEKYLKYFKKLCESQTTEKQAMAASILLVADELADRFIFKSGNVLTVEEISDFLKDRATASAGQRGYAYLKDWISINSNKFKRNDSAGIPITPSGDIYGTLEEDWAWINKSKLSEALTAEGFDYRAVISWLKSNDLIKCRGRNNTRGKRLNGVLTECVVLFIGEKQENPLDDYVALL